MNIAICDDDITCVNRIQELINSYNLSEELNIKSYLSGKEFIQNLDEALRCDIIFLDIEMPEVSGLDVAHALRENGSKAIVIFITSHINYVSDTFRLGAFQFLVKPVQESAFNVDFERAIRTYRNTHKFYQINWRETKHVVEYGDICYIEGYNRHLYINTESEGYECVGKIQEEEDKLRLYNFVRCHQGYIVNMSKIRDIKKNVLVLKNGVEIPVSRRYRDNLMEKFNLFLAGVSI